MAPAPGLQAIVKSWNGRHAWVMQPTVVRCCLLLHGTSSCVTHSSMQLACGGRWTEVRGCRRAERRAEVGGHQWPQRRARVAGHWRAQRRRDGRFQRSYAGQDSLIGCGRGPADAAVADPCIAQDECGIRLVSLYQLHDCLLLTNNCLLLTDTNQRYTRLNIMRTLSTVTSSPPRALIS